MQGDLAIEFRERGQRWIEARTSRGRIRLRLTAELEPTLDGDTTITFGMTLTPKGLFGRLILGAAPRLIPGFAAYIRDEVERTATELAGGLSQPEEVWQRSRNSISDMTGGR